MKVPTKIQIETFHLIAWLEHHRKNGIRLDAVQLPTNVCLINKKANFMFNFNLDDLKELQMANSVLCLWANKGPGAKTDYAGKSILETDDLTTLVTG